MVSTRFLAQSIVRKFDDSFLPTVYLVSDTATCPLGLPCQQFHSHLYIKLRRLGTNLGIFASMRVPPRPHVLHQRSQAHSVGVVTDDRSTRLNVVDMAYVGDPILVVSMKDMGRSPKDRVFDKLMQIFVLLVRLLMQVVDEVEQCQIRYADTFFAHVDASSLVECELFVDGL